MTEESGPLTPADFRTLLDASRALAETIELSALLDVIIDRAAKVVKAEAGAILLLDEDTGELCFDAAVGAAGEKIKHIRLKPGEGVAGWVAREGRPLIVNDPQADPRWTTRADRRSDFVTRQVVAVPLMSKGRLVGVIEAINKWRGNRFTPADQHVLEIFASQAGVAVENARLFARLREEKETLAALVGDMSEGAVVFDRGGVIRLINPAGARLLGLDEPPAPGRSIVECARPFVPHPTWKQALAAREPIPLELTRTLGQTLALAGTLQPLRDERGFLFVFRNVTEARREDRIKRNFLSFISHKLKTPLVSITGFAPLLLEDKHLSKSQREGLTSIADQGQKLALLVERLLDFVAVEAETVAINRRRLKVAGALAKVAGGLAPDLGKKGLRVVLDDGLESLPAVSADPKRFADVYRHLIENAAKFSRSSAREIRVYGRTDRAEVLLSVEDDGPGIPPEEQSRIFDRFHQVEENFTGQVEGAGLGLALAKRIVEAHGGNLRVRSVIGRGSVFTASWPVADDA